jgi:hypothetical protein
MEPPRIEPPQIEPPQPCLNQLRQTCINRPCLNRSHLNRSRLNRPHRNRPRNHRPRSYRPRHHQLSLQQQPPQPPLTVFPPIKLPPLMEYEEQLQSAISLCRGAKAHAGLLLAHTCATEVQRHVRGYFSLSRRLEVPRFGLTEELLADILQDMIHVEQMDSAVVIQSLCLGAMACARLLFAHACATEVQRHVRGYFSAARYLERRRHTTREALPISSPSILSSMMQLVMLPLPTLPILILPLPMPLPTTLPPTRLQIAMLPPPMLLPLMPLPTMLPPTTIPPTTLSPTSLLERKEVFLAYRFALQYYRSRVSNRSGLLLTPVTKLCDPCGAASTFPSRPLRIHLPFPSAPHPTPGSHSGWSLGPNPDAPGTSL